MPVALKLNGKRFELNQLTPSLQKVKKFLDSSPADELFTISELCRASKTHESGLNSAGIAFHPEFAAYTYKPSKVRYWGNPKAIAELRKQVGA